METTDALMCRRSVRRYAEGEVPDERLRAVVAAGLAAASGRGLRPWTLQVVRGTDDLAWLAACRQGGAASMLAGASAAVLVWGHPQQADTWVEDCSLVMGNMMAQAASEGLGTCWVQARGRFAADGFSAGAYVAQRFSAPQGAELECILSIGIPAQPPQPRTSDQLPWDRVIW